MAIATGRDVLSFARDVLGLSLYPKQAEALEGVAGNQLSLLCLGRRSGKTLLACAWAVYDAVIRDLSAHLRPGEPRYVVTVATSQQQAANGFRVIRSFFDLSRLAPLLVGETADELHLATGVIIRCLPCSARSTRGLAISTVILNELAHFIDTENGHQAGQLVYRALAPSVAQFGDAGRIICLSTPRGQRGVFWRLWNLGGVYRLQAATSEMNPAIEPAFLERERQRDPELYAQEFEAQFIAGGGAFLDPSALQAAVGIPEHKHAYRVLALDPAFHRDAFGVALVCNAGSMVCVEEVHAFEPPVSFGAAMEAIVRLVRQHNPRKVVTDQFAAAPLVEELARRSVRCTAIPWTAQNKAEAFSAFKSALNTGRLRLVDDKRLLRELAGLVATPTAAGFAVEGEGDDVATAAVLGFRQAEPGSRDPFSHVRLPCEQLIWPDGRVTPIP